MKALFFFLVATVICVQCNGQFTNRCLPRPMREVPVTLEFRNVLADFAASVCTTNGPGDQKLAITELATLAEQQIMNNYQQTYDCEMVSLRQRSCITTGKNRRHAFVYYLANLTCGDKCYHLGQHDHKYKDAKQFISTQASTLRAAYRKKSQSSFLYNDKPVEIFYFNGRKVDFLFNCDGGIIQEGVIKKIPACRCPSNCTNPCELPLETVRCGSSDPRYYHNATSGKCEQFIYGDCGGNQNNFITQDECETVCNVCPEGMVYRECGTACPTTCDNKDDIFSCTLQCVRGCFCKEGTVLLGENSTVCVAPEKCPVSCPEGMVYQECGTACPDTCDNKDVDRPCTLPCVQGCFCNGSTVLLEEGGQKCVGREECPPKDTGSGQECPEGMVYKECGTSCPTTCDNKDDEAVATCSPECISGCFCSDGTILLEAGGEKCVTEDTCPIIAN